VKNLKRLWPYSLLFASLFFGANAWSDHRALIIGGNAEFISGVSSGKSFRPEMFNLANRLTQSGWDARVILSDQNEISRISQVFSALEEALTLPSGSQLLLVMYAHGSEPRIEKVWVDQSSGTRFRRAAQEHAWSLETDEGYTGLLDSNDPKLLSLLDQLNERGIKIGVLDASCHGGATVRTFGDRACVVAAAAETSSSWGESVVKVLDYLADRSEKQLKEFSLSHNVASVSQPLLSLEEVFLYTLSVYPRSTGYRQQAVISGTTLNRETANVFSALRAQGTGIALDEKPPGEFYSKIDQEQLNQLIELMVQDVVANPGSSVGSPEVVMAAMNRLSPYGVWSADDPELKVDAMSLWRLASYLPIWIQQEQRLRDIYRELYKKSEEARLLYERAKGTPMEAKLKSEHRAASALDLEAFTHYARALRSIDRGMSMLRLRHYLNRKAVGKTSAACAQFDLLPRKSGTSDTNRR
jgi:hypothetical protein